MAITISYPLHMITHIFIPLDKIVPDVVLLLMLNRNLRFRSIFHILMHHLSYHKNLFIQRITYNYLYSKHEHFDQSYFLLSWCSQER